MKPVDIRDLDGTYVRVRPLDEDRCRVLDSNVLAKDGILAKDPAMSWEEAGEDLGGFTRLVPSDLEPFDLEDERDRSLLEDLRAAEASPARDGEDERDPLSGIPDRASSPEPWETGEDPRARLERLLAHYRLAHGRSAHEASAPGLRSSDLCRCPGYRAGRSRRDKRFHVLAALAARSREASDLERLVDLLRKARTRVVLRRSPARKS